MRTGWIIACAVGEAAGIAVVATAYAALDRGLVSAAVPVILAAGAWEGLCLGSAQAINLRKFAVASLPWISLTVAGAIFGYGMSLLGGAGSGSSDAPEPSFWLVLILGGVMGLAMGAVMGGLQWLAARRALSAGRWVLASMGGWALAMAAIMVGATSAQASWPLGLIAVAGAISGGIAGAALGLVTALALPSGPRA